MQEQVPPHHVLMAYRRIAAVCFNNVMVLFMILYPLAEELKKKHELSSALINKGMDMRNVSRRNKAVRVLLTMWKDRRGHQCGVTPEVTPEVSPEVDLEENVLVSVLLAYPYHSVIADAHHTQKNNSN